ncbi:Kinetochore-associated protein 1 [Zootermopsis nevadensis]|uniref:Kinetochore-associated protein 1 n=3 Tax=Zootermopsis nevadensis TaxID=136037 RepID=A0A067REJ8_ZOONE|nr:Kinetochore-associated protein 1 [Zootermopsis nevadensis]
MKFLHPWSLSRDSSEEIVNFNNFISMMNNIKDLEFICEACMKVLTVDLAKVRELLDYASDRLKKTDVRNLNTAKISSLESELWSTSVRLDTFQLVYQSDPENMKWCEFSRADLLCVCKQHLQQGQLSQASLIWARHWNNFKSVLSEATVIALLNAIPSGMKVSDLISWIYQFIPSVLCVTPQSMQHVVSWTIKSIKSLEVERSNWLKLGLDFAEKVLQSINMKPYSHLDFYHQQLLVTSTHCLELIEMASTLRQLQQLKENHKIHVALADFMQSDKSEVVSILLGKVAPVDIKPLMIQFLRKFMLDNSLVPDMVLSECIHRILSQSASWWYYYAEAPWEDTVAAVIPCINDLGVRVKCIISVLKMAPVPWSATVVGIAKQGLEVDNPSIGLLRHEQKMMDVKVVQKKYGFTKFLVQNCNLYDLMHQIRMIFKQGHEDMLQDALKYASLTTKLLEETYVICIEHYLEKGKQKQALELLDSLKTALIVKCCQRIVFRAQSYLQSSLHHRVRISYMEVLRSLGSRLEKAACIMGDTFLNDIPFQEVRNMHFLHLEFMKRLSLKDYSCVQSRSEVLSECISNILSATDDLTIIYCKVGRLTHLLQLSVEEGMLEIIHQATGNGNVILACNVMRNLLHFSSLSKSINQKLCLVVFHFLQTSFTASEIDACAQLAHSIASKACTLCSFDDLPSWLELFQWIHTALYITASFNEHEDVFEEMKSKAQDNLTRWNFTPLYKDPAIFSDSSQVMLFLKELFLCRLYHNAPGQMDNSNITLQLEGLAKQLQQQHHDLALVRLWCSLNSWALSMPDDSQSSTLLSETKRVAYDSICALLYKVIIARRFDVQLGLALLFVLGIDAAKQWLLHSLETFKQDFQKLSSVSCLGVLFCNYCKLDNKPFHFIHTRCIWAKRLAEYGIHCTQILTSNTAQNMEILQSLMKLKHVDILLILEYCSDFELERQECLLMYLETILMTWEPEFEIEKTVDGGEVMNVLNTDTEVARRCQDIIKLIENKERLVKHLTSIFKRLNYYNYEIYIYIINLLEQLLPSHNFISKKFLLMFLRKYRRVQGPKQEERDKWLHFPHSLTLPEISQWRLPFLPLIGSKPLLVLTPELNLKTYKQWIELSAGLGIDTNNICVVTVQQTIQARTTSTDEWRISSQDALLLNELEKCVDNISDLQTASACMYFVMNRMPPGADQVAAARLCYTYTQKWVKNNGDATAKEKLNDVKHKYLCLATTHILHQYDLNKPNYLQLVPKPLKLMSALYQDSSIIARGDGHIVCFPDINGAVEDLASLHEENYIKFCLDQLNKWLQPKGLQPGLLEDTCGLTRLLQNNKETDDSIEDDLLRACYILKCREGSSLVNYVVKLAFQLGLGEECPVAVQLRALKCLMAVSCTDMLEELTGRNIIDIRQMLNSLQYASELEMLGYSYSVSSFESCNKLELVKGIWRTQSNNPQALIVIARLCVEFSIQQHNIWTLLLKQMTKYSMVRELEVLMLHVTDLGHTLSSKEYVGAWESVLFTPFLKGEKEDACIHSLILLQSCPILRRINLNVIIEHSIQLHWPHLAAALLPLLEKDAFYQQKEKIVSVRGAVELIQNLQELASKGVLIAEKAIEVLQPVQPGINH